MTSMSGAASTAATSARWISAPVASPPACAIRSRWWPPSRVSDSSPSASWSNLVPSAISSRTASGPSVTSARTASTSQARRRRRGCRAGAPRGCPPARAPRRCRPGPTASSRRRARSLVTTRTLPTLAAQPQRRGQAGDAGADDDDVGAGRPAGRRRRQPAGKAAGGGSSLRARGDHPSRLACGVRPSAAVRSPRRSVGSPNVSAGSAPVPMILLSASTKTTCGWYAFASSVVIWP